MEKLYDKPDVVFKVEDQEFPAHRAALAYRSSYFKNAFASIFIRRSSL